MKKFITLLFTISLFICAQAQQDSLSDYTGKYKFPEGTVVPETDVVAENGLLTITSAMGSSELRKTGTKDVFEVVAYSGIATFKRSTEGKVTGIKIEVNGMILEGTKAEKPALQNRFDGGSLSDQLIIKN